MGLRTMLRHVFQPARTPEAAPAGPAMGREREWANAWLEALESGALTPPRGAHDQAGWDTYWTNHLGVGPMEQAFSDMMSSDEGLIPLLVSRQVRTILCAGNGLSTEALSLALHGFHVTALDISTVARTALATAFADPNHAFSKIPGLRVETDTVLFDGPEPVSADHCPRIHRTATHGPRAGGSLTLATGDFTKPEVCPGPFDAVIERRVVQLFAEPDRAVAIDRLAARLATPGVLISHHHDGCGRPGQVTHHAMKHLTERGFVLDSHADADAQRSAPRLARLRLSTG